MGQSIFQTMNQPPMPQNATGTFSGAIQFANPIQKMQYIMQAMTNPAAFMKQNFPDIPDEIANDPNRVFGYLQQTRNISDSQMQTLINDAQNFVRSVGGR